MSEKHEQKGMQWISESAVTECAVTHAHIVAAKTMKRSLQQQPTLQRNASGTLTETASSIVHRVTASPRQVKTQVAKITYTPSLMQHAPSPKHRAKNSPPTELASFNRAPIEPGSDKTQILHPSSNKDTTALAQHEFERKKDERDREIKEIQNMLDEMANSPQKITSAEAELPLSKNVEPALATQLAVTTATQSFRRSKTELTFVQGSKALSTRRDSTTARSRSSQPLLTKSSELMLSEQSHKKRSYNPEDARRFMEEQKKRRRALPNVPMSRDKTALEKEQIKKRLEELSRNTRQIVNKNLKKKRPEIRIDNDAGIDYIASPNNAAIRFKEPLARRNAQRVSKTQDKIDPDVLSLATDRTKWQVTARSDAVSLASSGHPLVENKKHVGLLRKPETKDHSFSAIKEFSFDKENVALDMLTPKFNMPAETRIKAGADMPVATAPSSTGPPKENVGGVISEQLAASSVQLQSNTCHTQIEKNEKSVQVPPPSQRDVPNSEEPQGNTELPNGASIEIKDLPFWLKPSAVQVYPYNFIVAVRRKLEAMAYQPAQQPPQSNIAPKLEHRTTSTGDLRWQRNGDEIMLTREPKKRTTEPPLNTKREKSASASDAVDADSFATYTRSGRPVMIAGKSRESLHRSQTLSDMGSNFSSISLLLPASNTMSEVSSLQSESVRASRSKSRGVDDSSTVSSSVFNSPEKRGRRRSNNSVSQPQVVSPLSLEKIEKLKVTSKLQKSDIARTENVTSTVSPIAEELAPQKSDLESAGLDFGRLLHDFNRSLTQVIQVNEQLKHTLDRSQQQSAEEYSNDFEVDATTPNDAVAVVKERSARLGEKLQQRKQSMLQIVDEVQPLLTSPQSEQSKKSTPSPKKAPELALNLESVSNSSGKTSRSPTSSVEVSPQDFEKRLHVIEELKTSLQQSISKSLANRVQNADLQDAASTTIVLESLQMPNINLEVKRKPGNLNLARTPGTPSSSESPAHTQSSSYANEFESAATTTAVDSGTASNSHKESVARSGNTSAVSNVSSPKAKTFTVTAGIEDASGELQTSSIEEQLQFTQGSSTHENNNYKASEKFIHSHITSERGDFLPCLDADAIANETQFKAAITAAAATNKSKLKTDNENSTEHAEDTGSVASVAPPSYKALLSKQNTSRRSGIGSEISTIFKVDEIELSLRSSQHEGSISESTLNYSSVGLYEQLIQTETAKSEQLTALLRLREKSLLDRTKGQIALLELQKERYKAKGWMQQIAAIKKKQRGILMKMAKEREEIKRLLQSTSSSKTSTGNSIARPPHHRTSTPTKQQQQHKQQLLLSAASLHKPSSKTNARSTPVTSTSALRTGVAATATRTIRSEPIVRANYELETSRPLEELLERREADLRRRREHVERLMRWHRRLDEEEADVLQLERLLLEYNNAHAPSKSKPNSDADKSQASTVTTGGSSKQRSTKGAHKMERRLREIDRSLRELSNISHSSTSLVNDEQGSASDSPIDFVRTTGSKLNKLWRRLTSQQIEKYEPNRRYKVCKADIERLYEEAKLAVLCDFAQNEEHLAAELLERTISQNSGGAVSLTNGHANEIHSSAIVEHVHVPHLHFSSSEQSEAPEVDELSAAADELSAHSFSQGNYSPSAAEENFKQHAATPHSTSASDTESSAADGAAKLNIRKFMAHAQQLLSASGSNGRATSHALQRSLSDTEIKERLSKTVNNIESSIPSHLPNSYTEINTVLTPIVSSDRHQDSHSAGTLHSLPSLPTHSLTSDTVNNATTSIQTRESSVIQSVGNPQTLLSVAESVSMSQPATQSTQHCSYAGQVSSNSESKAREISAKLEEISAAVLLLSQSNALPTYQSTKTSTETEVEVRSISPVAEVNVSAEVSYSCHFERLSTEMHSSPSGSIATTLSSKTEQSRPSPEHGQGVLNSPEIATLDATLVDTLESKANTASNETLLSKTFTTATHPHSHDSSVKNRALGTYEEDFESSTDGEETCIDDLSMPQFETTIETTQEGDAEIAEVESVNKETNESDTELAPPPPPPPPPPTLSPPSSASAAETAVGASSSQLMPPDIISELDIRRCQQILVENEQLKHYEHVTAVPYYMREIPNKPPPPYVPPAHGRWTTIFPSVERIRDISYRRTHELYCEMLKTDYTNEKGEPLPSVMAEKITNIYERIILDVCREYLSEHSEVLSQGDPINFHSQLAFFNPPDRLRCIQESVYKEVRRCLAMDKTPPKRTQVYSVYGQRARRDHIGKIIIQEMYDEDDKWCNFHREENEVLELIVEEMIINNIRELAKEVLLAEGGNVDVSPDSSAELPEHHETSVGEAAIMQDQLSNGVREEQLQIVNPEETIIARTEVVDKLRSESEKIDCSNGV